MMVDPIAAALCKAPLDDEPSSDEAERTAAEARKWLKHHAGIPFEQVVEEFGFTMEEVQRQS